MENRTLLLLILLFAALVGSLHLGYKRQPEVADVFDIAENLKRPARWQGKFAPDFELKTLDGNIFKLAEHVGKEVIILNFFATWCDPCNEEMPELVRFYNENKDKGVVIIGIDAAEKPEVVAGFIKKYSVTFPVGIDDSYNLQGKYGATGFPTTVLIGVDGKIQLFESGAIMNAEIAFRKFVDTNMKALQDGKAISAEDYKKGVAQEHYADVAPAHPEKDEYVLEGRAKEIASKMTCPCGCSDKVGECGCDTAKKIKKKLKEGNFGDKTDTDIIKELNAEFCVKESPC